MIEVLVKSKDEKILMYINVNSIILKAYSKEKIRNALLKFCEETFNKHKPNKLKFKEELGIDINNLDCVIKNPETLTNEYKEILSGNLNDKYEGEQYDT